MRLSDNSQKYTIISKKTQTQTIHHTQTQKVYHTQTQTNVFSPPFFKFRQSSSPDNHPHRRFDQLVSFSALSTPYQGIYEHRGSTERGVECGQACLVLQFIEDLKRPGNGAFLAGEYGRKMVLRFSSGGEKSKPQLL